MARLPRLVVANQPHHVIQRGNDRRAIFHDADDYQIFLKWLREASRQFKLALHAYVLMPNHFHLLVTPTDATGLSKALQWVGRYYVPYFNHKYGRTGTLWQGRFRATVIDSERYFMTCCRYIELNPVRAGLVDDPERYPWSSYLHHVGVRPDPYLTDHALYWALGNTPFQREAAYQQLVLQALAEDELQALRAATEHGWALGGDAFLHGLAKQTARRLVPGAKGRPRKKSSEQEFE